MKYFFDCGIASLNKIGEHICGDVVEIVRKSDKLDIVMSDGLGSGIKANILASLTTKIVFTMLKEGSNISDVIDTLTQTLPINREKGIAYSTFTILDIDESNTVYITEYENPKIIFIRNNKLVNLMPSSKNINGKIIHQYSFPLKSGDTFIIMSDGIVGAGKGRITNTRWQWHDIAHYAVHLCSHDYSAQKIANILLTISNNYYEESPQDDMTVVAIKVKKPQQVNVLICPPQNQNDDELVVKNFMKNNKDPIKRIVCGGSTAQMVCRVVEKKLHNDDRIYDPEVPPISFISGIDLVTEGLLTLDRVVKIIREFHKNPLNNINFNKQDAATQMAKILLDDATHINFFIGKAENPQHKDFYISKHELIKQLIDLLISCNKTVTTYYF